MKSPVIAAIAVLATSLVTGAAAVDAPTLDGRVAALEAQAKRATYTMTFWDKAISSQVDALNTKVYNLSNVVREQGYTITLQTRTIRRLQVRVAHQAKP